MTTLEQLPACAEVAPRPLPGRHRSLRILLLQVRDHPSALIHEQHCFLERMGLDPEQLVSINLVEQPLPSWGEVSATDLVVLGGAGSHSAHLDYPFTEGLLELVRHLVDHGRPFFGSCFGHQLLARALGGSVVCDPAGSEVGTFEVELTEQGVADALFAGMPRRFPVNLGHNDQVCDLPSGLVSLAFSDRCRHQVLRAGDKPIYATQFHCELSIEGMRQRLLIYRDAYLRAGEEPADIEARFRPTSLADRLLRRFLDLYF
jgi:GMP synthase (glutamine-hydrolysing)